MINLNNWKIINSVSYYKSLSVKLTDKGYTVTNTLGAVVFINRSLEIACREAEKNEKEWSKISNWSSTNET